MPLTNGRVFRAHVMLLLVGLLAGCAAMPTEERPEEPATFPVSEVIRDDVTFPIDVYDPFERLNRGIYIFNAKFDEFIFLPLVNGYKTVTPDFLQKGVSNFFDNIFEIITFANAVLQLKVEAAWQTAARFAINTTVGVLGTWDVATFTGIEQHDEDFGQTLGHYGLGEGPFLVLPILGPSNLRDTTGLVADAVLFNAVDPLDFDGNSEREIPFHVMRAIDTRARVAFRYFQTGSPFEYDLVRLLYTEQRRIQISR